MPSISFSNLATVDRWILIIGCLIYVLLGWLPMIISLYLVYNRANDKRSEKEFDQKWYKWKKQYMWHELWYRTHVIWLISIIVVFIFESSSWPLSTSFISVIVFVIVTIALKYTSKKVENRVPSDDQKKSLYSQVTSSMRSESDARDYLNEIALVNQEQTEKEKGNQTAKNIKHGIELQEKTASME